MSQINPQVEAIASLLMGQRNAVPLASQTPQELSASMQTDVTILPPIGKVISAEQQSRAFNLKIQIQREDVSKLEPRCLMADSCLTIYEHGQDPPPSNDKTISNAIQDDVRLFVAQIMQDNPTITMLPYQTGEQPTMVPLGQPEIDPQSGQPTGQEQQFPVTGETRAEWMQDVFDYYREISSVDDQLIPVLFNGAIAGWYLPLIEWDCATKTLSIESDISHRQTCIDTITGPVRAVEKATHAWVRWWIDRWKARSMYPHLSKEIEQRARTGNGSSDGVTELGGNVTNMVYGRKMVDLCHLWLRNQPYEPMTPWEAVQYGFVELQPEQTVADGQQENTQSQPTNSSAQSGIPQEDSQQLGQEATPPALPGTSNSGASLQDQPGIQQGPTFFITGTKTPIDPSDIRWPWWHVTRKMTFVDELLADDRVSTAWDGIPLAHFAAIPVPFTPFGQGLPWGKKNLQQGRNRALTNMVDHTDLFAHPILAVPRSAFERLPEEFKKHGASRAGMLIVVEDDIYTALGGKIQSAITAEPISVSLTDLMAVLKQELTDRADAPEVSGGKQTGDVTGWQTTQLLQQTAANRYEIAIKSIRAMVWRIAQMLRHEILWRLNIDDLMQACSKFPPQVVQMMQQQERQCYTGNIEVVINNSGGARGRKMQENIAKFNTVDEKTGQRAIELKTLQQRWNEDADEQSKEFMEIQQMLAQAAQGQQQKGPSESIGYGDLPPSGQLQMAAQAGIQLTPEDIMAHQQQQQAQKQQEMAAKAKQNGNGDRFSGQQ